MRQISLKSVAFENDVFIDKYALKWYIEGIQKYLLSLLVNIESFLGAQEVILAEF